MKNKKMLAFILALCVSLTALAGLLTACTPTTDTDPKPGPAVVDDKIDWTKAEEVDPGYGNIGTYKQVEYSVTSEKSKLKRSQRFRQNEEISACYNESRHCRFGNDVRPELRGVYA